MIKLIPEKNLSTADIKVLREITNESLSSIKEASIKGNSIIEYKFFEGDWENVRETLKQLYVRWENDPPPFTLIETDTDELISIADLYSILKNARELEIQQQRNSDLEMGYINNPEEFEKHDEDWI
ncbi:hypothetical protein KCM76_23865 [Zooshikella marina]|uniref:hypothetical protein n=1 Tax=Zooshikella ganghwensis TaxID=202772 RepID=UPI001BAFDA4B|nr:hypothetical protein [Zooshikella ganghwensis]MBU2709054.1 hypothetical protein [Zooshikella ganghwensis]